MSLKVAVALRSPRALGQPQRLLWVSRSSRCCGSTWTVVRPTVSRRVQQRCRVLSTQSSEEQKRQRHETTKDAAAPSFAKDGGVRAVPLLRVVRFVGHQWQHFKETMHQYWVGTKLLWLDVQTSSSIARRLLTGRSLTRRERKQLTRTTADLFRVVPFAVFVIVPFLEFLLPVALYLFPSMLPSTFQDSTKREETAKAMLRARLSLAGFLGETLAEIQQKKATAAEDPALDSAELAVFVDKARRGDISTEDVTRFARAFRDELTLDNLKRPQLVVLCRYMNMQPFGPDALLRFQLRNAIRELRADDQKIVYEGLDSLTRQEMQEACAERGMRALGLTKQEYRSQLEEWLELAANRQIPIAILIMSRAFTLNAPPSGETQERALLESISTLDADVVNEAVLEAAAGTEPSAEMRERKLEFLTAQNRLIAEERAAADAEEKRARNAAADLVAAAAAAAENNNNNNNINAAAAAAAAEAAADLSLSSSKKQKISDADAAPPSEKAWAREMEDHVGASMEVAAAADWDGPVGQTAVDLHGRAQLTAESQDSAGGDQKVKETTTLEMVQRKLDVAEMLEVMSHLSALEREKCDLETLKAKLKDDEDEDVTESSDQTKQQRKDGKLAALKRKLTRMTTSLEVEIQKVDARLGDKLHIVDQDNDGVIDQDELRHAVRCIIQAQDKGKDRHTLTDDEVDAFVDDIMEEIDLNDDGILTVEEVEHWHDGLVTKRDYMASLEK